MSTFLFNKKRRTLKNELKHSGTEKNKKKTKRVPILTRATGFLYGVETRLNKFIETKENFEELFQENQKKDDKVIIDEPSPEYYGQFFELRKKIIFGHLMENEYLVGQFIGKTQKNMMKNSNLRSSYFEEKAEDIYDTTICFKETVANYCLVIKLYMMKNNFTRALELFLLMIQKNKRLFEYIYKKIKEQFPKVTNANRIGKFFPLIIRKYLEILSCLVKLSIKFNKPKIHYMLITYYLKTYLIVSHTVENKFGLMANGNYINPEIKNIGKYLYANIYFDIGIFYFISYHSLLFITKFLKHVLDLYQNNISNELLIVEKVLLLKTNYDLGLFLYSDGQSHESIQYILRAKNILTLIKLIPLKLEYKSRRSGKVHKIEKFEDKSLLTKLSYNKSASNINKEENTNSKELRLSNKKSSFRKSSGILFGNQMTAIDNQFENVEEKISNEIELLLAEIELSINGDQRVVEHINKLLKSNNSRKRSGYAQLVQGLSQSLKKVKELEKEKEENFCNYRLLNDYDKRKMMFLLDKIDNKYSRKNDSMDKIYKIKSYNYENSKKYYNSKEMEKFFLFICSLSQFQLQILNESQPKSTILRNDLPIIITNQFKDCLTNSQRMNLTLLESMSLSRYLILKDPNEDITLENLDFLFMQYNIKDIKEEEQDNNIKTINKKNNERLNKTHNQRNRNKFFGTNFSKTNYKGNITDKDEKVKFNKMLDAIITDKNVEFIEMFRESIINVLINLNSEEKELLYNSKTFLKDLVKKIEKSMIIKKK